MRYKAMFVVGFATGYVFGSRAGRQRYEQLKRMSRSFASNPAVKHTTESMQAQATQLGTTARRAAQAKADSIRHDLVDKVNAKIPAGISGRFGHHTIDLDGESTYTNGTMT
ncbi:MAG: hypothetical protein ACRDRL_06455 [Sciscionella sp.]